MVDINVNRAVILGRRDMSHELAKVAVALLERRIGVFWDEGKDLVVQKVSERLGRRDMSHELAKVAVALLERRFGVFWDEGKDLVVQKVSERLGRPIAMRLAEGSVPKHQTANIAAHVTNKWNEIEQQEFEKQQAESTGKESNDGQGKQE